MSKQEFSLFEPKDDKVLLTTQYRELGRMKEFRELKHHEQRFVWGYACVTSRFVKANPNDLHSRSKQTFEWAYGSTDYSGKQYQDFCSLIFPDHIKIAIARMEKFDPSRRGRALAALESEYDTCLEVLNSPIPGKIGKEQQDEDSGKMIYVYEDVTPAMIKQVIEAKEKAREALPELIRQLEEGFGIIVTTAESKSDFTDADLFIKDLILNTNSH